MAVSFDETVPVLHMHPNSFPMSEIGQEGDQRPREKRFYFLWPAFARQLLVNRGTRRQFNLFQTHVFRLCNAGVRAPEKIANLLTRPEADPRDPGPVHLARRILEELASMKSITARGEPTPEGIKMFNEDATLSPEIASITSFQDPWTGQLWMRFIEKPPLPIVEPQSFGPEFARVMVGGTGHSRIEHAFVVKPNVQECPALDPNRVLPAYKHYRNDLHDYALRRGRRLDNDASEEKQILGVAGVGDARPVFLITYAVCLGRDIEDEPWDVVDPFGLGVYRTFLGRVRSVTGMTNMKRFAKRLEEGVLGKVGETKGAAASPSNSIWSRAEQTVKEMFPPELEEEAELFDDLVSLQIAAFELTGKQDEVELVKPARTAITGAKLTIHKLFNLLERTHPINGQWQAVLTGEGHKTDNVAKINQIARRMGFNTAKHGKLPHSLTNVRAAEMLAAATTGRADLINAKLLVILLTASQTEETRHPLWRAARSYPRLLLDVDALAQLPNEVSSDWTKEIRNIDRARTSIETAFRAVQVLLYPDFPKSTRGAQTPRRSD
jgi:hypothetical protein